MTSMMTPREIEAAVFNLEQIRLVIYAPNNISLPAFLYMRKASDNTNLSEWFGQRISPLISGHGLAAVVFDGTGVIPHGLMHLGRIRASYVG